MRFLGAVLLCLLCSSHLAAQGDFYLKDGDTVVFYGDSITDQRLYTTFTEAYVLTRFPKLNIRFIHSGWSGDRVTEASVVPSIPGSSAMYSFITRRLSQSCSE